MASRLALVTGSTSGIGLGIAKVYSACKLVHVLQLNLRLVKSSSLISIAHCS